MKVVKPVVFTPAMLTSSTIPELDTAFDPPAWAAGTYNDGDLVSRTTTHRVYRHVDAGAGPHSHTIPPEDDPDHWKVVRPTNKFGAFDTSVGTATVKTGVGAQSYTFKLVPGGPINSISFFEINAQSIRVQMRDTPGGTIVYDTTVNLDETELPDWYAYFFEPFSLRTAVVLTDLPPYGTCEITVIVSGSTTISLGNCVFGTVYTIGSTEYGAGAGIRDYSKKTEDPDTGVISLEQRRFSKTMRARFKLTEAQVNFTHRLLSGLRSTPCVWIGDNGAGLEPLLVYGFYKDFQLDLPTPNISYYSLEVEGMV